MPDVIGPAWKRSGNALPLHRATVSSHLDKWTGR